MAVNGIAFTLSIELALAAESWLPPRTCAFGSWRSAAGSCRSAAPPSVHPRSSAGERDGRFLLTAEEFGAAEALRIGLVQEVVPAGTHLQRARNWPV